MAATYLASTLSHAFKLGDSNGSLSLTVVSGLVDPSTATAKFSLKSAAGTLIKDEVAATIASVTTASDGTKGCTLSSALSAWMPTTAGLYFGEFSITYPAAAGVRAVPAGQLLTIRIEPSWYTGTIV